MYAEMISNRAFDSDDIGLFLVYAREAFKDEKDSVIAGFGDTLAHSIRDRGQLQEISKMTYSFFRTFENRIAA